MLSILIHITIRYSNPLHIYRGCKSKFIFQNLAVKVNVDSIKLNMENLLLIKTLIHFIIWKGNENRENESEKNKKRNKELKSLLYCLEGDNNLDIGFFGYFVVVLVSFIGYCCFEGSFLVEFGNLEGSLTFTVGSGLVGFTFDFQGDFSLLDCLTSIVL